MSQIALPLLVLFLVFASCSQAWRAKSEAEAERQLNLGNSLVSRGKIDEGIAHFRRALEIAPDYAGAHLGLANALAGVGRDDEAIKHYQTALRLAPSYAEAHNGLGLAMAKRGRIDEAITQYRQALAIKPDYADAKKNLDAAIARRDGKKGEVPTHQLQNRLKSPLAAAS